jgi:hypothetical protein
MSTGFKKLDDGTWGLRGKGLSPGQIVSVQKKAGGSSVVTVGEILHTDPGGWQTALIATTGAPVARTSAPRRQSFGGTSRRKKCISGGNCSSFGGGRSCGGYDCDGF